MYNLSQNTIAGFMDRFSSFNDAVLRRLEHSYESSGRRQTLLTYPFRIGNLI